MEIHLFAPNMQNIDMTASNSALPQIMEKLEDRILFDAVPDGGFLIQPPSGEAPQPEVAQIQVNQDAQDELAPRELILVDANVENADALISAILEKQEGQSFEVRLLKADRDGIEQISEILDASSGAYDAIHILSHGSEGQIQLGNSTISSGNLSSYASALVGWTDKLTQDADLLLYGCNLAGDARGAEFLETLSTMTGADVAASTDLTGHELLGGDWDLEHTIGQIDSRALSIRDYFGTLNSFTIQATTAVVVEGDGGVGTTGKWSNAGFVDTDETVDANGDGDFENDPDFAVDIVATVVEVTGTVSVDFQTVSTIDPLRDDMRARVTGNGTATVRWEIFEAGTTNKPSEGKIGLTISDIDGNGGPETVEGVAASLHNLSSYTLQSPTNLHTTVNDNFLVAQGTQNQNDEEPSWVRFNWSTANELLLTYYVYDNGTRFFNHDGDGDLVFTNPDTRFTQGIDLDVDDSSGATGSNYQTTYIDGSIPGVTGDVPVSVADADMEVFDLNDTTLQGATIVLTNASAGDQLNVNSALLGALGVSANVDTSVPGKITVTLSGESLIENYESAIKSITYSNVNTSFDKSYVRIIEINATDGTNVTGTANTTVNFSNAVNAPTAAADFYVLDEDSDLTVDAASGLLANDDDPQGDSVEVVSGRDSAGNLITIGTPHIMPSGAELTLYADGSFSYMPPEHFSGAEFINYNIDDGNGNTGTAFATINVNPIADQPTLVPSFTTTSVNEDSNSAPLVITIGSPDTDGSETLELIASNLTLGATLTDGVNSFTANSSTTSADITNWNLNNIQFRAAEHSDVDQSVRLTLTTTEPNGDSKVATQDINFVVNAVADAPLLTTTDTGGALDQPVNIGNQIAVALVDTDGSETLASLRIENIPVGAQLLYNGNPLTISSGAVTISESQLADLVFQPPAGGIGVYSLDVYATSEELNPENGVAVATSTTGPVILNVTIDNIDDPIVPHADVTIVASGQSVTFDVLGNDEVPDGAPEIVAVDGQTIAVGQTRTLASGDGTVTLNSDGTLTYEPSAGASGTIQFAYTVQDYDGSTAVGTVYASITDPIVDDNATTDEDTAVSIDVLGNDPVTSILPATITNQTSTDGTNGTTSVSSDGSIVYTPADNYSGSDSFTYEVTGLAGGLQYQFFDGLSSWRSLDEIPDLDPDYVGIATDLNSAQLSTDLTGSSSDYGVRYYGKVYIETADSYEFLLQSNNGSRLWINGNLVSDNNNAGGSTSNVGSVTLGSGFHDIMIEHYDWGGGASLVARMSGADTGGTPTNLLSTGRVGSMIVTQSATVNVVVNPVNDDPTAATIPNQENEDAEFINGFDVSSYFSDVEGDALTYDASDLPTGLSISSAGVISGTIDNSASQTGSFSVTVTADDGNGGTVSQSFTWTISNPAPTAAADAFATDEHTQITGNITNNNGSGVDSDPDGDDISVSAVAGSAAGVGNSVAGSNGGSFTIGANGNLVFDPGSSFEYLAQGETTTTTVTYTISDGEGGTSQATITVNVTGINDATTAVGSISDQMHEDNALISGFDVSSFFDDLDTSDVLSFSDGGSLPPGLSIHSSTGVIAGRIDKSASQSGPYEVTITASDGNGGVANQTFTWTVTNPGPQAQDDDLSTTENASLSGNVITDDNGNGADSDPDGDALAVSAVDGEASDVGQSVAGTAGGSFVIESDGSYSFDPGTDFDDLASGETRTTAVTYTITDNQGGTSTATVEVTVTGTNDVPTAIGSVGNQSGIDGTTISPLDVSGFFDDVDGTLEFDDNGTLPPGLSIHPTTGLITGTLPNNASVGGPYEVTITADDGDGGTVTQAFTWTVTNPGPQAQDDDLFTTENAALSGNVITDDNGNAADSDPDGDALAVSAVNGEASEVGKSVSGSAGGSFVIESDGSYSFDPGADFDDLAAGETRTTSVTYTITDKQGGTSSATVEVTVTGTNDVPTAVGSVGNQSGIDGTTIAPLDVSSFFDDVDGTLEYDDNGTLPPGLSIHPTTGLITGTFPNNASVGGPYEVTITADDGDGGTVTQAFTWTVTNPGPQAQDDDLSTTENASLSGNVITADNGNGADSDSDGDALIISAVNGEASDVGQSVTGTAGGSLTIESNGSYSFDPGADFDDLSAGETRTTSVTYTITDNQGGTSTATVEVTVTGTNDVPTAVGSIGDQSGIDGTTVSPLDVSGFFDDVDGTLEFDDNGTLPPGLSIHPTTGLITGTLPNNASVGGPYEVTITADDGDGGTITQTFTWTVTNPGPQAQDDDLSTTENASLSGNVITDDNGNGADSDPDGDALVVSAVNGEASDVGQAVSGTAGGSFTIESDGSYNFDPGSDFDDLAAGETRTTSVTYTITDNHGGTSTATIEVTVTGTNDAPTAIGSIGNQSGIDGTTISPLDVSGFFDDVDGTLEYDDNGTLPPGLSIHPTTGLITGTLPNNASVGGPYEVTITADDGDGGTVTQTFTWAVTNPGPQAQDDDLSTTENAALSGNVITADNGNGTDSDPDGDALIISAVNGETSDVGQAVTGTAGGSFVIESNGSYSFDPGADFDDLAAGETRTTSVTYTITDNQGGTSTATVEVTVTGTNDVPTAIGSIGNQSGIDGTTISPLDVSGFFDDVDGTLEYDDNGTLPPGLSIHPTTGLITGTLPNNASVGGPYEVTITADDGDGGTVTQTFTWGVTNPGPQAQDDDFATTENVSLSGNVITADNGNGADRDPDGDALVVSAVNGEASDVGQAVTGTAGGSFTIGSNGSYSFNPGADFDDLSAGEIRTTSVIYTITDNQGGTSTATVEVTVTGTNDAPTAIGSIGNQSGIDGTTIAPLDVSSFFDDVDGTLEYDDDGTLPPGLSIHPTTGLITGTLPNNASVGGPYEVTIIADDGDGGTVTQTFTWTVTNPGPQAQDDDLATTENASLSGNVITADNGNGADSDPDGDALAVSSVDGEASYVGQAVTGTSGGSFTIGSNGSYSFDPGADFDDLAAGETRTTSVTYTITDNQGGTSTATVEVTVTGTNDAPTAIGSIGNQSGIDGTTIAPLNISSFFDDVDGTLEYDDNGTLPPGLSVHPTTGLITGTLPNNTSVGGPYEVTITADDGDGGTVTQTFTWAVTNPGPQAQDDDLATTENASLSGNVITADNGNGADSDPDGDALIISAVNGEASDVGQAVTGTAGGSFTIESDGSYSFDPGADFDDLAAGETRTTSVTYTISDNQGGTSTATVEVTVTGTNDVPTAVGSIGNQSGIDGTTISPLDLSGFFDDVDGTLEFDDNGTLPPGLSIHPTTGLITGTLPNNASLGGPYEVTITADDGDGGTITQTFTWTVTNPGPQAQDDDLATTENASLSGNVIIDDNGNGADSDPDGDALVVSAVNGEASDVGQAVTGTAGGSFTIGSNGSYSFNPGADFDDLSAGETRTTSVTYTVTDNQGGTSTATVEVTVTGTNDVPTTVGSIGSQSGIDGTTIAPLDVSSFFDDVDGTLEYDDDGTLPPGLSIHPTTGLITGTLPNNASVGGPYEVTITASDGNGGVANQTFTWTVTNPGPQAQDDDLSTTENASLSGNVITTDNGSGADSDPDGDALIISAVNGDASDAGQAVTGTAGGSFLIESNGSYSFDPGADFDDLAAGETRTTSMTYTISDNQGGTSTATVEVTVTGTNDVPTAVGFIGNQSGIDGTTISPLDVSGFFDDVDGTLEFDDNGTLPPGLSIHPTTGLITGSLPNDASVGGPYEVTITADDGDGGTVTQTFTWTVTNPGPQAQDDDLATSENASLSGNVITADNGNGADSDPDGDALAVSAVDGEASDVGQAVAGTAGGSFTIETDGSYSFDPGTDFDDLSADETRTTSATYTSSDDQGGTSTATVEVTVTGTNDAPTAVSSIGNQSGIDGTTISPLDVSGFFDDVDGTLEYDDNGTLPPGLSVHPTTGLITGTLPNNTSVGGPYEVTITADDGDGGTVTQTFTWAVTNPGPQAQDDDLSTTENASLSGNVITADNGNGADSDPDGDALVVSAVNGEASEVGQAVVGSAGGSFVIETDGSYSFDPGADFDDLAAGEIRTTSVTYAITDNQGGTSTATVEVMVTGTNDVPTAIGSIGNQSGIDGTTISPLDVSGFFDDVDGTLEFDDNGTLPPGLFVHPTTGLITGTLPNNTSVGGPYEVTITADDGDGGTVTQTFTWTVTNPGPQAQDDDLSTTENAALSGNVITADNGSGADSDPDGDALIISAVNGEASDVGQAVAGTAGGSFTIGSNGSYSFDPGTDFDDLSAGETRTTSVTYTISDNQGGASTATVEVTVTGTNDVPTAVGSIGNQSSIDGTTISPLDVSGFFDDVDGTLEFDDNGTLPPGLSIHPTTGLITGTLPNNASVGGPYEVTITADDGDGGTVTQTFTWAVTNPGPQAQDDDLETTENASLSGNVITDDNGSGVDSDPDGDALAVSAVDGEASDVGQAVTGTAGGSIVIESDGSYSFDPGADFDDLAAGETRTTSVTYTITDNQGGTSTATVEVTVTGTNDVPTAIGPIGNQSGIDGTTIAPLDVSSFFDDVDGTLEYDDDGTLPPGLSIHPTTGLITGSLPNDASVGGPYEVTITADDGDGGTVTQAFTWAVTNPGPQAQDDDFATTENVSLSGNVITADNGNGADSDPDGDALIVSAVNGEASDVGQAVAGTAGGSFTIGSNGSYSFDPGADFDELAAGETRTTSLTYKITDNQGGTSTATVEVTVTGTNDVPTAVGSIGNQSGIDGTTIAPLDVSSFFDDVDGTLEFDDNGTLPPGLSVHPTTGLITGTLPNNTSVGGPYEVTITADDGDGGTVTRTFTWTVTNPGPQAQDDDLSTTENALHSGNVIIADNGNGADSDPDGDALIISAVNGEASDVGQAVSGTAGGSFTIETDGSYSFDPGTDSDDLSAGETRTTSVTYTITDNQGGTSTATVEVTVTGTNDVPTAVGSIGNQSGIDGATISPLDVSSFFDDVDGTLEFDDNGTLPPGLSIHPTNGLITGTLPNNASVGGPYEVTITADDGDGGTVTQTFTWAVTNPGPQAQDDDLETTENASLSGNVITADNGNGADSDPDSDALVVSAVDGEASDVGQAVTGTAGGSFVIESDGSYSFDPGADFDDLAAGETRTTTVTYTITDNQGGTSTATVEVTVTGANDVPTTIGSIGNQSGIDGTTIAPLNVSSFFDDVDGTLEFDDNGTLPPGLSIHPTTGLITGTLPNNASVGGPYEVTITADDRDGGTVTQTFTWAVTNPGPQAQDDDLATTENAALSGNVITADNGNGADSDPDGDALIVSAVNGEASDVGQAVSGTAGGSFTIGSNGSYSFDPGANFDDLASGETRTTSVTYTITDSQGGTSTATVEVTVTGTNDVPTSIGSIGNQSGIDGTTVSPLDVSGFFDDVDGTLEFDDNGTLPPGLSVHPTTGLITGTLPNNTSVGGPYEVTITADDGDGGTVAQTFTWAVTNPGPQAQDDDLATTENAALSGNVITADNGNGADSDPDGDALVVSAVNGEASDVGQSVTGNVGGSFTIGLDGSYSFDPGADFDDLAAGETRTTSVTYTISDNQGGASTATVEVTVTGTNDVPTAIGLIGNQSGIDGTTIAPLDVSSFFDDVDGTLEYDDNGTLPPGLSIHPTTGLITGTLPNNASVGGPYEVTITVDDGDGGTVTQTFTWAVTNPTPQAFDNVALVTAANNPTASGNVVSDDDGFGLDSDDDLLTVVEVNGALSNVGETITTTYGEIVIESNGDYTYELNESHSDVVALTDTDTLIDSVTYSVSDGQGGDASASLQITIRGANETPELVAAIPDQANVDGQDIGSLDLSAFFIDPDGDTLAYSANGLPPGLSIDAASGIVTGQLTSDASQGAGNGEYTVTITARDPASQSVSTELKWSITNLAPTASDNRVSASEGSSITGNVITDDDSYGVDTDPDGDPLQVVAINGSDSDLGLAVEGTQGGRFIVHSDGEYSFDPLNDFEHLDSNESVTTSVSYTLSDGEGGTSIATLLVEVSGEDDPIIVGGIEIGNVSEDGTLTAGGKLSASDIDASDNPLNYTPVNGQAGANGYGDFNIDAKGNWTYELNNAHLEVQALDEGETLSDSFDFIVTNQDGASETQTVTVTITGADDPIVVVGTTIGTASEDGDLVASGKLTASDPDTSDNPLSFTSVTDGLGDNGYGEFSVDAFGNWTFKLNNSHLDVQSLDAGESLTDSFEFVAINQDGASETQTVTVTITGADDPIVVGGVTTGGVVEDGTISTGGTLTATDVDTSDRPLSYTLVNAELGDNGYGDFSIDAAGNWTYDLSNFHSDVQALDEGEQLTDSFDFVVTNQDGATEKQTVVVTITGADDPIVVGGMVTGSVVEDVTFSTGGTLTASDVDTSDNALSYTSVTNQLGANGYGDFSIDTAGNWTFELNNSHPDVQKLDTGESLTDSFGFVVSNRDGALETQTVTVTITGADDPIVVSGVTTGDVVEDGTLSANGTLTASDVDASDSPLLFTPVSLQLGVNGFGDFSIDAAGNWTYQLDNHHLDVQAHDEGETLTDSFDFKVTNQDGDTRTQTVTVRITGADDPIVTGGVVSGNTSEDGVLTASGGLTASDRDTSDNPLTYSIAENATGSAGLGTFSIDRNGQWIYQLSNSAPVVQALDAGQIVIDSYTFTVTNNDGDLENQTVTITVLGQEDAPVVDSRMLSVQEESTNNPLDLDAPFDADGDLFSISVTELPDVGVVKLADGTAVQVGDLLSSNQLEALVYDAPEDHDGSIDPGQFVYSVSDGSSSVSGTVDIVIQAVNDNPNMVAHIADQEAMDGDSVMLDVSSNFIDPDGDLLSYSATGLPPGLSISDQGVIAGQIDGNASQAGPFLVQVTAKDPSGAEVLNEFTWTVGNPKPNAVSDSVSTIEDTTILGSVAGNDFDPDRDSLTFRPLSSPTSGNLVFNSDGSFVYTPAPNFNGVDAFSYEVEDADGGRETATVTILVNSANDSPTATTPLVSQSGKDGDVIELNLSSHFGDIDGDNLSFSASGLPLGLSIDPVTGVIQGTIDSSASANGPYLSVITVDDGNGGTTSESFVWVVTNPAPVATANLLTSTENAVVIGNVLTDDDGHGHDSDPDGDTLSVIAVDGVILDGPVRVEGSNGGIFLVHADGTYEFEPGQDFDSLAEGETSVTEVTYVIQDDNGATASERLTIHVVGVNDAPNAYSAILAKADVEGDEVEVDISAWFGDPDHADEYWFVAEGLPPGLSIDRVTGVITGELPEGSAISEPYVVTISATDTHGESSSLTVAWQVTPTFAFDAFNNPLDFGRGAGLFGTSREVVLSEQIESLAPEPILAGQASPGAVLVGRIYASDGSVIGEVSTQANQAGNWVIQFFGTRAGNNTRIVIEHVATEQVAMGESIFRLGEESYRSLQLDTSHTEDATAGTILSDAPSTIMERQHSQNLNPLSFL